MSLNQYHKLGIKGISQIPNCYRQISKLTLLEYCYETLPIVTPFLISISFQFTKQTIL